MWQNQHSSTDSTAIRNCWANGYWHARHCSGKNLLPKVNKAYKKVDEDITRTASLDKCLRVCIGARVMLKCNINVEARLVNGAIGLVTGFENRKSDSGIHICSISVKFENVADSVKIERQSSTFKVCQTTAEATRTRRKSHRRTIAVVTN